MLLGFQRRFLNDLRDWTKPHTIRGRPAKIGETLYQYVDLRKKTCERVWSKGKEPVCKWCYRISISNDFIASDYFRNELNLNSKIISYHDKIEIDKFNQVKGSIILDSFARQDGFINFKEQKKFFKVTKLNSYQGFVIGW
jgi:hypothetical protein